MDNPTHKRWLIQKKQALVLLKKQAKELTLTVRRRQYQYNHHYGLALAGAVLALLFIDTHPMTIFIAFLGMGMFVVSAVLFIANVGSKTSRKLKETWDKIAQLKCEIIELEYE